MAGITAANGGNAGRVDDGTGLLRHHDGGSVFDAEEGSTQQDADLEVELLDGRVGDGLGAATEAGVVVEDVETAEALHGGLDELVHVRFAGDVGFLENGFIAKRVASACPFCSCRSAMTTLAPAATNL